MAKTVTREQCVKQGKRFRNLMRVFLVLRKIGAKKVAERRDVFIDTEFGRVRVLLYGFGNAEKLPVYFDLHGGGFILGSADMDEEMNLEMLKRVGCKIVGIDYAKAPDFPYPAAVNQVYAVVSHFHDNADKYAIDKNRMAIGGHSAGGNLSAVACMKAKREGRFRFSCQILDYPPLDLATSPFDKPCPKGAISPKMASMFDACYIDPKQAKEPYVSPVYAAREDLEGLPPALVIAAGRDSLHDEAMKYAGMLRDAGVATECHEYPNAAHGFTYKRSPDTIDAWEKMATFLKRFL